ncbi:uncharacterized protein BJX67DRAFT_190983 [Aspergillus lucknowensis]|uniref:Uncharacterized protein n=1 Tax=Aspergillus lucknowensis TaxID=176173 RepID=A0ABR4LKF1_9EURO
MSLCILAYVTPVVTLHIFSSSGDPQIHQDTLGHRRRGRRRRRAAISSPERWERATFRMWTSLSRGLIMYSGGRATASSTSQLGSPRQAALSPEPPGRSINLRNLRALNRWIRTKDCDEPAGAQRP